MEKFRYEVKVLLELTGPQAASLYTLARHHYDSVCQGIAVPGTGAWLHGAIMRALSVEEIVGRTSESIVESVRTHDGPISMYLTRREIGTALKVLEMASVDDWRVCKMTEIAINKAMSALHAEDCRLNGGA